jgi:hypothetical protein
MRYKITRISVTYEDNTRASWSVYPFMVTDLEARRFAIKKMAERVSKMNVLSVRLCYEERDE